eukprot:m.268298 g.268298  ORF g.268298 m.268298 type:complete len:666 (+) comp15656_c0_seq2:356-2353(+)
MKPWTCLRSMLAPSAGRVLREAGRCHVAKQTLASKTTLHASSPSWTQYGLQQQLRERLDQRKFDSPTPIQAAMLEQYATRFASNAWSGVYVVGAETGSGKTLAYLVPVVDSMLKRIQSLMEITGDEDVAASAKSDALIVVPSNELAGQLMNVSSLLDLSSLGIDTVRLRVGDAIEPSHASTSHEVGAPPAASSTLQRSSGSLPSSSPDSGLIQGKLAGKTDAASIRAKLFVTTAGTLGKTHAKTLAPHLSTVVLDEFDSIFSSNDDFHTWNLIKASARSLMRDSYLERQRLLRQEKQARRTVTPSSLNHTKGMDEAVYASSDNACHSAATSPQCPPATLGGPTVFLVGATLPNQGRKSIMNMLKYKFKEMHFVTSSSLHTTVPKLRQLFHPLDVEESTAALCKKSSHSVSDVMDGKIGAPFARIVADATPNQPKFDAVLQHVQTALEQGLTSLVFCNSVKHADEMFQHLNESLNEQRDGTRVQVGIIHKKVPKPARTQTLKQFGSKGIPVICCTDLLARGIDLDVDLVIQADFSTDIISYLHRVGRTARNGRAGCVVSMVDSDAAVMATEVQTQLRDNMKDMWHAWREPDTAVTHEVVHGRSAHDPNAEGSNSNKIGKSASGTHEKSSANSGGAATDLEQRRKSFASLFSRNRSARKRRRKDRAK